MHIGGNGSVECEKICKQFVLRENLHIGGGECMEYEEICINFFVVGGLFTCCWQ